MLIALELPFHIRSNYAFMCPTKALFKTKGTCPLPSGSPPATFSVVQDSFFSSSSSKGILVRFLKHPSPSEVYPQLFFL